MSDYNSASENSELFQAALVRARKLVDYANATSARFKETMEAIQDLPKAERGPHIEPLVELFELKLNRMLNSISACSEFLKCADLAPDFAKQGQERFIAEIREAHQENIKILKGLSA